MNTPLLVALLSYHAYWVKTVYNVKNYKIFSSGGNHSQREVSFKAKNILFLETLAT